MQLCMLKFIYVCIICTNLPTCRYAESTYVCIYLCRLMYVGPLCIYLCMCLCVCLCVSVRVYVCIYLCFYVCIYLCVFVCAFVCVAVCGDNDHMRRVVEVNDNYRSWN